MDDLIAKFDKLGDDQRTLIATITKTWLAKGEDPTTIAGHVRRWLGDSVVAKNSDEGASNEGAKPPEEQRDPTQELEDLVDAYVEAAKPKKVKRTAAYEQALRARPDLNAALAKQRDVKLRKAAKAFGDGYGVR